MAIYVEETTINALMAKAEKKHDLKLSWIRTARDLLSAEKAGLFSTYCQVFAEPPWTERFEIDEVRAYFTNMLAADGFVFMAQKNQRVAAFVASVPLTHKDSIAEIVRPHVNVASASYFAEDAVIPSLRRQGISQSMKHLLLESTCYAGFDTMVLRTSIESHAQIAAVRQIGFQRIDNLTQSVESLKLDGSIRPDTRIFFTLNLAQPT